MQSNDPHILAAMDGRELTSGVVESTKKAREEPTAFFFIIFGLVYEALSASSADSTSGTVSRQSATITALQTLKCLLKPEYAGKTIMEPTIFDEFISVSYRMAMTEGANIQIHLVEMLSVFATTQDPIDGDNFSLTSPRAHCLRICSYILRHSTSPSRGPVISQFRSF